MGLSNQNFQRRMRRIMNKPNVFDSYIELVGKDKEIEFLSFLEEKDCIDYTNMEKVIGLSEVEHYILDAYIDLKALGLAWKKNHLVPLGDQRPPRYNYADTTKGDENLEYYDMLALSMLNNIFEPGFSIVKVGDKARLANGMDRMTYLYDLLCKLWVFTTDNIDDFHTWNLTLKGANVKDLREESDEWNELINNVRVPVKIYIPLHKRDEDKIGYNIFDWTNTNLKPIHKQHAYPTGLNRFIKDLSSPLQFDEDTGGLIPFHLVQFSDIFTKNKNLNTNDKYYNLDNYKFMSVMMTAIHVDLLSNLGQKGIDSYIKNGSADKKKFRKIEGEIVNIIQYIRDGMGDKNFDKFIKPKPKVGALAIRKRMEFTYERVREIIIFWRYFEEKCNLKIKDSKTFWHFIGMILRDPQFLGFQSADTDESQWYKYRRSFANPQHQLNCITPLVERIKIYLDKLHVDIGAIAVDKTRSASNWPNKENVCYITGHKTDNPHTAHIIPWANGGITDDPNLASVDESLNSQMQDRYMSEYVAELLSKDPQAFTSANLHDWQNGRMDKVIAIEEDTSNYAVFNSTSKEI